jgi:hypothetical protein
MMLGGVIYNTKKQFEILAWPLTTYDAFICVRVSGGFPVFYIKYIAAYTCYPPRSETSHDGGLVVLHLRHISHVLSSLPLWLIVISFQGDTFKETEESQNVLHMGMSLQACRGSV